MMSMTNYGGRARGLLPYVCHTIVFLSSKLGHMAASIFPPYKIISKTLIYPKYWICYRYNEKTKTQKIFVTIGVCSKANGSKTTVNTSKY